MLYLSYDDTVKMDLRMNDVVPAFEEAYRRLADGGATTQYRVRLVHPPLAEGTMGTGRPWQRDLRILPAILPGLGVACRLGATAHGYGSGVLLIYWDFETMAVKTVISDELVHGVRSAAPDGPLTKYLAKKDASVLGVIGTGRIARWAAEAAWSQRPIKTMKVYSRDAEHRAEFCAYVEKRLGVETVNCTSNDEAVSDADVVVMATSTRNPVINGDAIPPGCTVISNTPEELDVATIRKANKVVATLAEEIEIHVPPWQAVYDLARAGEFSFHSITQLSDIMTGKQPGRESDDEIIVCLNPGSGIHDVAASRYVYYRALELGLGTELPT
ncbi:MAG: Ornithine cyclodeaminase [Chloroflexi bacterium]|nr:Ornithine cyclodeaminase [Chloroflexota bacterium]